MNLREWALPLYTILMQLAVGALVVLWAFRMLAVRRLTQIQISRIISNPLLIITFTVVVAMVAAHLHLSRPLHSFYAVRNFRSSWLSREIVFTVAFFLTLATVFILSRFRQEKAALISLLGWLAAALGLTVVYCMARIYLLPTQLAWNSPIVIISFYVTTLLLGTMTISCLLVLDFKFSEIQNADDLGWRGQVIHYVLTRLALVAFALVALSVAVTFFQVSQLAQGELTLQTSLQLLFDLYAPLFIARLLLLGAGSLWMGYAVYRTHRLAASPQDMFTPVYMSCLLILIAEIIGRFLFYATHIRLGI